MKDQIVKVKKTGGRPRAFADEEAFEDALFEYFGKCEVHGRMPTRAGFCVFMGVNRETYYAQKDLYPNIFACAELLIEDGLANTPVNQQIALRMLEHSGYSANYKADQSEMAVMLDMSDEERALRLSKLNIKLEDVIGNLMSTTD